MPTLYDENGDLVEGALDPDSAKELQEKAEKFAEFEKALEEKESELEKLRQKDLNFKNLNWKNQKELEEKTADWSDTEKALRDELAALREGQNAPIERTKNDYLEQLSGGDEKLKEKLLSKYEVLGKNANTEQDIKAALNDAALLVENEISRSSNPVNTFQPSSLGSGLPRKTNVNFADTEEGKNLAKSMGLEVEVPKK